ncbi:aminotransferase class V-fold PLP-dependent enzyme [Advenella mimigardefordensis]|uniref:Putative cysteine desulfurase/aminotransferase class 5 n=1 Tax=Advenella mimigardefordensis (strain DSM 17166 / LMG 22922 / DPN7) TaxID=1247726 RepID=W0P5J0_ADVMD|nr:aminotransferase class V-fold PLP-dependent enzyme [Advenella mimigardefordensis]AHG62124.1 putative cysteine desulfurase/aminotransferase class 5 [Advenella mimigardefordensis DPN7]
MTGLSGKRLESLRHNTPSVQNLIYLNHASASLAAGEVIASMHAALDLELAQGVNRAIRIMTPEMETLRQSLAHLLGGQPHNIAFADTTTSAWAFALEALTTDRRSVSVVAVRNEWGMNILSAMSLQQRGLVSLRLADNNAAGSFDPVELATTANGADVVAVPLIPSSCGVINPIAELKDKLNPRTLVFVDAAQAAGQIPVHPLSLGADVLVFPARKWLRGPKGIAVLYVSDRALSQMSNPFRVSAQGGLHWGSDLQFDTSQDARKFESYEFNPAVRAGLKQSVELLADLEADKIKSAIDVLGLHLKESFRRHRLPALFEKHDNTSGIWTFSCPEISGMDDIDRLRKKGLELGSVFGESNRLVLSDRGAKFITRISIHYFNTKEDIENGISILADDINMKRR